MNWKVMSIGLLLCIPLICAGEGIQFDPNALPEELTGEMAPDFTLTSLEGYENFTERYERLCCCS